MVQNHVILPPQACYFIWSQRGLQRIWNEPGRTLTPPPSVDRISTRQMYSAAPIRRFGASSFGRFTVLAIGLAAMTAYTVPELAKPASGWLNACLWCCLAYFAVEGSVRY